MFDLILTNITQRKLRPGLTIFGIALGIFAVIVMGGMSEHFNLTFDRSISLTADKIRVLPEGGFFGADMVIGLPPDKLGSALKDTKLTQGRLLVSGDGYRTVLGSNVAREF